MTEPVLEMLRQGGLVLVGIVLVSILAWTLIVREWLRLSECMIGGWAPIDRAIERIRQGLPVAPVPNASSKNFVGRLLRSGTIQRRLDRASFEAQVLPLLKSESLMFQRTLRLVGVLAASMPLLGLLGTVLGMMRTFTEMTDRGVAEIDALSGGVSQALVTTQAGLVIAVPLLLVHGILGGRVRHYLETSRVMVKKIETAICLEPDAA